MTYRPAAPGCGCPPPAPPRLPRSTLFENERVLENVKALDAVGREMVQPLMTSHDLVGDVRVQGCFLAVELIADASTKERAPELQLVIDAVTEVLT